MYLVDGSECHSLDRDLLPPGHQTSAWRHDACMMINGPVVEHVTGAAEVFPDWLVYWKGKSEACVQPPTAVVIVLDRPVTIEAVDIAWQAYHGGTAIELRGRSRSEIDALRRRLIEILSPVPPRLIGPDSDVACHVFDAAGNAHPSGGLSLRHYNVTGWTERRVAALSDPKPNKVGLHVILAKEPPYVTCEAMRASARILMIGGMIGLIGRTASSVEHVQRRVLTFCNAVGTG